MRSRCVVALLSLGFVALPACGRLAAQARGQDTRPGVAVMPFDNGGSYGQDRENFDALQEGIAGMLISGRGAKPAARGAGREGAAKAMGVQARGPSGGVA